ncbi:MAG: phage head closure protein [Clostridia bacterium]|nr:phage head closure protein [Clostridia bacterium]
MADDEILLNDGILKIYKVNPGKTETGKPTKELELLCEAWFSDINNSISEFYSAKQADVEIEKRVEILQNKEVSSKDIVEIDNKQYSVGRIYHGYNKDGIPITDMTLEKVVKKA